MGVLGLGAILSFFHGTPVVFLPIAASLILWTPLGLALFTIVLARLFRDGMPSRSAAPP
jgi:hypothetical protein